MGKWIISDYNHLTSSWCRQYCDDLYLCSLSKSCNITNPDIDDLENCISCVRNKNIKARLKKIIKEFK